MKYGRQVDPTGMLNNYKTKRRIWVSFRRGNDRSRNFTDSGAPARLYIMNIFLQQLG
jgi:hypothetical protein